MTARKKKTQTKSLPLNRNNYQKGALGAGMAYALLAILVVSFASVMMIGNITPHQNAPTGTQPVIIITKPPEPQKSNLQLYTFPGATYTPTPTPTTPPQPDQSGGDSGGSGEGDGGHSAPDTGGGGQPQAGIAR